MASRACCSRRRRRRRWPRPCGAVLTSPSTRSPSAPTRSASARPRSAARSARSWSRPGPSTASAAQPLSPRYPRALPSPPRAEGSRAARRRSPGEPDSLAPPPAQLREDEGVALPLVPDGGLLHVARQDDRLVGELQQPVHEGRHELFPVAALEIRAADGAPEERVAAEEHAGGVQRDAPLGVAGRVEHPELDPGHLHVISIL